MKTKKLRKELLSELMMCNTHLLSVFPFHPMVPLHNMGVKCLLVLGGVVATLPVAREPKGKQIQKIDSCLRRRFDQLPYVLSFSMLLPCVFIQQVFVAVSFSTSGTHVLFRYLKSRQ